MDLTEKRLSRKEIFQGHIVNVHIDTVELPNGAEATREVVDHPGGVAVLALDGENNVLTVTQYRYPFGTTLVELPAGKLDHPGEDTAAAGLRELKEETGAVPGRWGRFCRRRAAMVKFCTSISPRTCIWRNSILTRTNS